MNKNVENNKQECQEKANAKKDVSTKNCKSDKASCKHEDKK